MMGRQRIGMPLVLMAILVWPAGCTSKDGNTSARPTVYIGSVLPLSGESASYGWSAKAGMELALSEINRSGNSGSEFRLLLRDDADDGARAVAAMEDLIAERAVPLVIGSATSGVTRRLCDVATREKVVLVTPISSASTLTTQCGAFFFRLCPSDAHQARMMAAWIKEDYSSIAVLHEDVPWADDLYDQFATAYRDAGGDIVEHREFSATATADYRGLLANIARPDVQAVYVITYPDAGVRLLAARRALHLKLPIFGADVWATAEFLRRTGPNANGVKTLEPSEDDTYAFRGFVSKLRTKYPDLYVSNNNGERIALSLVHAAYAYDAVYIATRALAVADSGSALRAAIANTDYSGATGRTRFDYNGDSIRSCFRKKTLQAKRMASNAATARDNDSSRSE